MLRYDTELLYHTVDRTPHHQVFLHRPFCKPIPEEDVEKVIKMCCGEPQLQMVPSDEFQEYMAEQGIEFLVELTWRDACAILILNYREVDLMALKLKYGFNENCI